MQENGLCIGDQVVLQHEYDGWAVVWDDTINSTYAFNPVEVCIWNHIQENGNVTGIIEKLEKLFHSIPQNALDNVQAFVRELLNLGLIVPSGKKTAGRAAPNPSHTPKNNPYLVDSHSAFRKIKGKFSVSGRRITEAMDIRDYIRRYYYFVDLDQIDTVFGTSREFSPLYGGWGFNPVHALTERHISTLTDLGIGFSLTLSNHYFTDRAYKESLGLLKKYHHPFNSVICVSDELARRIKSDFPDYHVKASVIKDISTPEGIEKAMELYDQVVLPNSLNSTIDFISGKSWLDRIVLFANGGCGVTCPKRTCHIGQSQKIAKKRITGSCSKTTIPRQSVGYAIFDVLKLEAFGIRNFKLIPPKNLKTVVKNNGPALENISDPKIYESLIANRPFLARQFNP